MPKKKYSVKAIHKKIDEALHVLKELGLPREQLNQRSALTLLALLDLKPDSSWVEATAPLMGITPMMDVFSKYYNIIYAPNTRETVRRFTVHQFLQAGIIMANPDCPTRPTNSPKAVYQIEPGVLDLLRSYGSPHWSDNLEAVINKIAVLKEVYARARQMNRIPVIIAPGKSISLSPGPHNELIQQIINDFCPLFTPGGQVVYVGDTAKKWAHFDTDTLTKMCVNVDEHGKMPDVVVYYTNKNWLVLIEAVTSHGPVNPKRHQELKNLFGACTAGLVFVTAFLTRNAAVKYMSEISWETEVWIAEHPTHMIHFNGERFLGPH